MVALLLLVADPSGHGLPAFADAVRARYASHAEAGRPHIETTRRGNAEHLAIRLGDFLVRVHYTCEPHVRQESAEIAETFAAARADRARLAAAPCRYELSSDDDPDGDHLNDMIFLVEAAETLPGVVAFDPAAGEFL